MPSDPGGRSQLAQVVPSPAQWGAGTASTITITDAVGLQQVACFCYGIVKAEFDLITGDR